MRQDNRQEPRSSRRGRCQPWGLAAPDGMSPPCPLGCHCPGNRLPAGPSRPCQSPGLVTWWLVGEQAGGVSPLHAGPATTSPCLPVLQVPVPVHGPAGCHVTQRGAAFRVSHLSSERAGQGLRLGLGLEDLPPLAGTLHVLLCPILDSLKAEGCPGEPALEPTVSPCAPLCFPGSSM